MAHKRLLRLWLFFYFVFWQVDFKARHKYISLTHKLFHLNYERVRFIRMLRRVFNWFDELFCYAFYASYEKE